MLRAMMIDQKTGESYIILGLSHKNLDNLKAGLPMVPIDLREFGIHGNLLIFSEVDEQAMADTLKKHFKFPPPDTSSLDA